MKTTHPDRAVTARQRILHTADRLFYQDGLRATGIDRIIAESDVAKMSFYRHFPSKSDLIVAFLEQRDERWMTWFKCEVEARIGNAGAGLEVIADVLVLWFRRDDFRGCVFINTFVESGTSDAEASRIAVQHKTQLTAYLESLAKHLHLLRPHQVAEAAMIVIEGTIVRTQIAGDESIVAASRRLLKSIGQAAMKPDKNRPR